MICADVDHAVSMLNILSQRQKKTIGKGSLVIRNTKWDDAATPFRASL